MKICSRCKQEKDLDDFHNAKSKKDGKQPYCKTCLNSNSKKDYKLNNRKDVFIQRGNERRRLCVSIASFIKEDNGCACCTENTSCCLDFHHSDDDKIKNVSDFAMAKSKKKLLEEIRKCVVVCSNCHRKIHAGIIELGDVDSCKIDLEKIELIEKEWKEQLTVVL